VTNVSLHERKLVCEVVVGENHEYYPLGEHIVSAPGVCEWYRGRVCTLTQSRTGTIIKDDAVPSLLQRVSEPTFVTWNWSDFWQQTEAHPKFCIICFAVPSGRATDIPALLRRLLRLGLLRPKQGEWAK
jgi:hypothetical protein